MFRKYFVEILCEATDWSVVADPVLSLSNGQESSVLVNVSGADTEMIFTVYWSGYDNAVEFNLKAPNGKTYYPNASASGYTYKGSGRYAFYRIKPAAAQAGQWQMRVKGKNLAAGKQVRLSASAFSRSGTKMSVELDNGIIHTGDKNLIAVRLMHYGRPVKGADVKAYLDSPKTGFGNLIKYNPVDVKKLAVTKNVDKNDMDILQSTTEAVRTKLGDRFNLRMNNVFKLYDDGTHGDRVKDDGIYSVSLMNTRIPGSYTARIKAEFKVGGKTATREWTKTFTTKVAADPRYSVGSAVPASVSKKAKTYSLNITPKDRFGNYMGPGHKLTMKGVDGKEYVFKDNLDGSYTLQQTVKAKSLKTRPQVQIKLDDVDFTRVTLK